MATTRKLSKSSKLALDIQFGSAGLENRWVDVLTPRYLRKALKAGLQQSAALTVRFVGNAESRRLNREFRQKDYPTNILTFNYPADANSIWADLVICIPVVTRESKDQKKSFNDHLTHLLVHGVLHAQGLEHEDEIEAEAMESLEVAILAKLGINNPYQPI